MQLMKHIFIGVAVCISSISFAQKNKSEKNKFLEGKKFSVNFYELKAGAPGKAVPTMVLIKGGKVEADLMYEKFQMQPMSYIVNVDSTFTEDEVENRIVSFEAMHAQDKNDYKWEVTINNTDIEGTVVILKSGVEKKRYEFSGREKIKK